MSDQSGRSRLLDGWRGLLLILMVVYHLVWDLEQFGFVTAGTIGGAFWVLVRWYCSLSFVLLAGLCCRLSHSNLRRGLIVLSCGVLVMAVTLAIGQPVLFGILQMLGLCMLLYAFAGAGFERIPDLAVWIGCPLLFLLTRFWTSSVTVTVPWLFPLGFVTDSFYSADFYPLLPWIFCFFLGTRLGGVTDWRKIDPPLPEALCRPGRHSLLIYLLHQPVLYGLVWLTRSLFG